ncbi:MAG: hypothetical protein IDH49_00220 [Gammaproteobacteria bacterium]|nr:hypothetical protein [Gammaproteobacteria bacterium]
MKHTATMIGLDIAKNVFYAAGKDERGHLLLAKRVESIDTPGRKAGKADEFDCRIDHRAD